MSMAPTWIAIIPHARTMWGGLMILTSSPYAVCHQLSNGADAIIMSVPQMHTQAPNGPRNPQNRTPAALSAGLPLNVTRSTSQPQLAPATSAAICSSTWGGDQNVSRPIVRCHEMSQISPTTIETDENSTAYSGHVCTAVSAGTLSRAAGNASVASMVALI
jgi:hypothetical protein